MPYRYRVCKDPGHRSPTGNARTHPGHSGRCPGWPPILPLLTPGGSGADDNQLPALGLPLGLVGVHADDARRGCSDDHDPTSALWPGDSFLESIVYLIPVADIIDGVGQEFGTVGEILKLASRLASFGLPAGRVEGCRSSLAEASQSSSRIDAGARCP